MVQGFATGELRCTDVLTLGCGAAWGCIFPSATTDSSSSQALPCMSRARTAGHGLSPHRQESVWGVRRLG